MKLKKLTNSLLLIAETDIERKYILNIISIKQNENGSFVLKPKEELYITKFGDL